MGEASCLLAVLGGGGLDVDGGGDAVQVAARQLEQVIKAEEVGALGPE